MYLQFCDLNHIKLGFRVDGNFKSKHYTWPLGILFRKQAASEIFLPLPPSLNLKTDSMDSSIWKRIGKRRWRRQRNRKGGHWLGLKLLQFRWKVSRHNGTRTRSHLPSSFSWAPVLQSEVPFLRYSWENANSEVDRRTHQDR